ncbi:MAG TPA: trypsin-like peptidase domain-containing protein [Gemmataceae bacterium]|nr:trypsin-like peptidase domain-containing protein [Gemmataceae bacterium]
MDPLESASPLSQAITTETPHAVATPTPASAPVPPTPAAPARGWSMRGVTTLLFSLTCFLSVFVIGAWAAPQLAARWRAVEARAEADAAYQRRRAELRAEADAADERLQLLDKRLDLVTLGFRDVVRKVSPCVVNLTSYADAREPANKAHKDFPKVRDPDTNEEILLAGSGSGIIVEPEWVLTNYHVVAAASKVRVTFASGRTIVVPEERIKTDPMTDLAVLHLPAAPPGVLREDDEFKVEFGNSDTVERGDLVLALGNPLGLKHTVTHGIISAKGRLLDRYDAVEVLQTDAPINKGNSGGPLFDQRGRMIGVNFAIASDTGFSQGIGFAIPSNTAKDVYDQLKTHGEVIRGYLGTELAELPHEQAQKWTTMGAVRVGKVTSGEPASKAGDKTGDVILSYNGEQLSPVYALRHLRQLIMETKVGQKAQLEVIRGGQRQTIDVTVGKRPPDVGAKR